jgi:Flp pilus assembly protein TadB
MSLVVVCALAFGGFLALGLLLIYGPLTAANRKAREARVTELRRYRVLAAQDNAPAGPPLHAPGSGPVMPHAVTDGALRLADRAVRARGQRERIAGRLERSGVRMRPEEWALIQLSSVVAAAALFVFLLHSILGVLLGAPLAWLACRGFLAFKTSRRRRAFEQQLPDALQLVAGALRSGFALNQSIGAVAREGAEPVASEFSRALREVQLGAELDDALDDLALRVGSYDLQLVVMAIRTAREIGGNLAEVLQTTVTTMRERVQLRSQVRALSAEGRFSAKVLTGLPILMAAYLFAFKRAYIQLLVTTGLGIAMLTVGGVLLVIGSVWLHKLTKIEV